MSTPKAAKGWAWLVLVVLAGCSHYENVDLRTLDRAEELCKSHGGLSAVSALNFYKYGTDTMAEKQFLRVQCHDESAISRTYETPAPSP